MVILFTSLTSLCAQTTHSRIPFILIHQKQVGSRSVRPRQGTMAAQRKPLCLAL